MSAHLHKYCRLAIIGVAITAALVMGTGGAAARTQRVVVIDPGHGGAESGVTGPDGVMEKYLALDLAERIANHLRNRYRVVLTRTSDVGVAIDDRAGRANNENADAFVSLHVGGSLSRTVEGITIYYYTGLYTSAPEPPPSNAAPGTAPASQSWRRMQIPHRAASSALANRIKVRLDAPPPPAPVTVTDAPVRVLMGAGMPAVVIEVGYLTNPREEKRLMDSAHLSSLAMRISQGIDDFFNKIDAISTTDLKE
ncbi:MAG: N-acetylmuramoyl-L-alanine amidase [Pseudomonadota bacterium]